MIQLGVKEDFPVSRSGLAWLKGPTAQSESCFISVCLSEAALLAQSYCALPLNFVGCIQSLYLGRRSRVESVTADSFHILTIFKNLGDYGHEDTHNSVDFTQTHDQM